MIEIVMCEFHFRYIGYFGNADPLDTSQWFRLAAPPAGAAWEWNDATSVCSSMITGINVKTNYFS